MLGAAFFFWVKLSTKQTSVGFSVAKNCYSDSAFWKSRKHFSENVHSSLYFWHNYRIHFIPEVCKVRVRIRTWGRFVNDADFNPQINGRWSEFLIFPRIFFWNNSHYFFFQFHISPNLRNCSSIHRKIRFDRVTIR